MRRVVAGLLSLLLALCASAAPAVAQPPDPVAPDDFVALAAVDPTIVQEIRYFTPHNFTGEPSPATSNPCAS